MARYSFFVLKVLLNTNQETYNVIVFDMQAAVWSRI